MILDDDDDGGGDVLSSSTKFGFSASCKSFFKSFTGVLSPSPFTVDETSFSLEE